MERGKVKWFNEKKGFGFIERDNGKDIFLHFTGIAMDGFKTIEKDTEVQFDVVEGKKGLQASNVTPITTV